MDRQDWIDLAWSMCAAGAFVTAFVTVSGVAHLIVARLSL